MFDSCLSEFGCRRRQGKIQRPVKAASRTEIVANDYSLTPGRYVGVATTQSDDDDIESFKIRMTEIHAELASLNGLAEDLSRKIQDAFSEWCDVA